MQNGTLRDCCVVDAGGLYRAFVTVQTEQGADGEPKETVLGYKLVEGERLIDAAPPNKRLHAGSAGFVKPCWDEETAAWVEGASAEELAAWEAEHPAPEEPEDPTPPSGDLEQRVTTLEETSATKTDVQAIWDEMAAAYTEGVNSI